MKDILEGIKRIQIVTVDGELIADIDRYNEYEPVIVLAGYNVKFIPNEEE